MRKMIWVKTSNVESWACSECAWIFKPTGPPHGFTLEEMKQNFERERDQEFTSHVCARYKRPNPQMSRPGN
jgi:rubredoxin